VLLMSYLH